MPLRPRVALLALLLVPLAAAHVQHERPKVQESEELRGVQAEVDASRARATYELLRRSDPPTDFVRHVVDMRRGSFVGEYRPQASDAANAFRAEFVIVRVVEYRDQNGDGAYTPGVDPMVRGWTPGGYTWVVTGPELATVADVQGRLVRFQGNASGSPGMRMEVMGTGVAFVDEGASVRQQDLIAYFDLEDFPVRGTGNLHAIEGLVRPPPGADVRLIRGENFTAGVAVTAPGRLALLDWGAEGVVDGKESRLATDLDPPAEDGTSSFRIHLPLLEDSVRLVMVSAVEYAKENKRADAAPIALALLAVVLVALARRPE